MLFCLCRSLSIYLLLIDITCIFYIYHFFLTCRFRPYRLELWLDILRLETFKGAFHGWQRQPNDTSVQQTLEEALSTILRSYTPVTGAGRTDTGVHARTMAQ